MLLAHGVTERATVHAVATRIGAKPTTFAAQEAPSVVQDASHTVTLIDDTPAVRVLYLVPKHKHPRPTYARAIRRAIRSVQAWYQRELAYGNTFGLNDPVVEVFTTPHRASWYQGQLGRNDFFFNVLHDATALAGEPTGSFAWVIYIDAHPACGQIGGAGIPGFAVLPANDLRGLTDQPILPRCPDEQPDLAGVCRWVGGLGHELGHAFGLPHPAGCEEGSPTCPSAAMMWLGFREYPSTFLLEEDKLILDQSPLFQPIRPLHPVGMCGP
jgi:hypothetical protein